MGFHVPHIKVTWTTIQKQDDAVIGPYRGGTFSAGCTDQPRIQCGQSNCPQLEGMSTIQGARCLRTSRLHNNSLSQMDVSPGRISVFRRKSLFCSRGEYFLNRSTLVQSFAEASQVSTNPDHFISSVIKVIFLPDDIATVIIGFQISMLYRLHPGTRRTSEAPAIMQSTLQSGARRRRR